MKKWFNYLLIFLILLTLARLGKSFLFEDKTTLFHSESLHQSLIKSNSKNGFGLQEVQGYVKGLPFRNNRYTQFLLQTEKGLLQLSWYQFNPPTIVPGQYWKIYAKLKPPRGLQNPGGFDYSLYLKQQGIVAKGYVLPKESHWVYTDVWLDPINWIRFKLKEKLLSQLDNEEIRGILIALAIGDQSLIQQPQWEVFRRTGTSHLMAISGPHVTLAASVIWFIVRTIWGAFSFLALRLPAQSAAWLSAWVTAVIYSALAGFSVPTQRTLIMFSCFVIGHFLRRNFSAFSTLIVALLAVILWEPTSVSQAGTWLSFGAVSILFYCFSNQVGQELFWKRFLRPQWVMTLGLIPLTAIWFHQFSLVGFIANLLAIPLISFWILPCLLISMASLEFSNTVAYVVLQMASYSFEWLYEILKWLSHWNFASVDLPPTSAGVFLLSIIGILWLLAPPSVPRRYYGAILLLPLILRFPERPPIGEAWISILDVGQGLSVVIETHEHVLIYDAGPSYPDGFDAGKQVLIPFLISRGIYKIDRLVISHGDNDHSGGTHSLINRFFIKKIESSAKNLFVNSDICHSGESWQWDQVHFTYLDTGIQQNSNNRSCVLRVLIGENAVLLPGDIEKGVEKWLIAHQFNLLPARLLIAPHHGSRTSSTESFIRAVSPKYVVFSTGFENRFNFPHPLIVERYRLQSVQIANTAEEGAVQFKINRSELEKLNWHD